MSWTTKSLSQIRQENRDYIVGKLRKPLIPNDYPRVLADANAGNAHLALQYLDWLSDEFLPDTAIAWLDRHANIWLVNADGSRGRKVAAYAQGALTVTGLIDGVVLPQASQFIVSTREATLTFESTADVVVSLGPTTVQVRALDAGTASNLPAGTTLSLTAAVVGIDASSARVIGLSGGADRESNDEVRARVLERIQEPPMGGDAGDYVAWALAVPGVTRAWCSPGEMGIGTVSLRFMCDDLRATSDPLTNGFPLPQDVFAVRTYLDTVRPVTVKDLFVLAPVPEPISFTLANIDSYSASTRSAILASVTKMLRAKAAPAHAINGVRQPAQTIFAAWVSAAVLEATGVTSFDLVMADHPMPNAGCMAVPGTLTPVL